VLAGTLSFAGTLTRMTARALAGSLTFAGTLSRQVGRALAGVLSFVGTLVAEFIAGAPSNRPTVTHYAATPSDPPRPVAGPGAGAHDTAIPNDPGRTSKIPGVS
jgi:hypothetical protein